MRHSSAEVEVGDGSQKVAGGGGVPIGSARGRGGLKNSPLTKISKEPENLLKANRQVREMVPDRVMETHKVKSRPPEGLAIHLF